MSARLLTPVRNLAPESLFVSFQIPLSGTHTCWCSIQFEKHLFVALVIECRSYVVLAVKLEDGKETKH